MRTPLALGLGIFIGAVGHAAVQVQAIPPLVEHLRVSLAGQVHVAPDPDPHDFVMIREGTTYTVPAGKLFVATAVGQGNFVSSNDNSALRINGVREFEGGGGDRSVVDLPAGLSAAAGATVEATNGNGYPDDARVWGYLIDA